MKKWKALFKARKSCILSRNETKRFFSFATKKNPLRQNIHFFFFFFERSIFERNTLIACLYYKWISKLVCKSKDVEFQTSQHVLSKPLPPTFFPSSSLQLQIFFLIFFFIFHHNVLAHKILFSVLIIFIHNFLSGRFMLVDPLVLLGTPKA